MSFLWVDADAFKVTLTRFPKTIWFDARQREDFRIVGYWILVKLFLHQSIMEEKLRSERP